MPGSDANDAPPAVGSRSLRASLGIDDAVLADIRAAGGLLTPRIGELLDDFYRWLEPLPDFARFFGDDRALLARVKSHQAAYWKDFLQAVVDDAYVERRRVVGQVHARIELGLFLYLRAMDFVSTWMVRRVEGDAHFVREHPTVAFSLRKLVHFDSAVVVHTYATRTAQVLEQQRARLQQVASVMQAVTVGDLEQQLEESGPEDLLGSSVNEMVKSLRAIAREMRTIAQGDYSADVAPRSEKDELGFSLQVMTRALREAARTSEQHLWLIRSQAELAGVMSGNPTVDQLAQDVLAYLCRTIHAPVGLLYVAAEGGETLRLAGRRATSMGDDIRTTIGFGEGLIGQAALDGRRVVLDNMPADCIRVQWGMGEAVPRALVVVPLRFENETRGVIELASLETFTQPQLDMLDHASSSVALSITAAETRATIGQLLEESRAQAEELASQQEELRAANEAMARQTSELELQKESLMATETALRQQAVQLERASRYKSDFLANMSHELRTPLNSSLILAKLLVTNREGNLTDEQVRYARSIYSAGNDLLALINDILDLSKIEAGKVELDVQPVDVPHLVDELKHRFDPLASDKGLAFSVAVADDCPRRIDTDAQRLQQILTNLLSNAIKFTERGGIGLRVRRLGPGELAFAVEDTGIGIAREHHEAVFEAFRQADGTTSRRFGGTGLGLSICRELASMLHGEIRLRSAPGEGSTFTLALPVATRDPRHHPPGEGSRPPARQQTTGPEAPPGSPSPVARQSPPQLEDDRDAITDSNRVILIVEDDPAFAEIVRDQVRELGLQCVIAGCVEEGLGLAREHRPWSLVLDIGLPDQSGLTLLETLKADPAMRHVPILVVSVHDHNIRARSLGAAGYLLKPVQREELVSAFRVLEERFSRPRKHVLIVEDNREQRGAISELLAADDVDIVAVGTAPEALDALHGTDFDCLVVDLMLPEVSGFELLQRISRDERLSLLPIVVYTARSLSLQEEHELRRYSRSIIIKGARSPERLLEEVTLFLHQEEASLPADKQRMLKTARDRERLFDGRRVLLVEDDVRNIFALTSMLETQGIQVDIARSGAEAVAKVDGDPTIDVVLMDVMMPEMDGITATRRIRELEGNGHGNGAARAWGPVPIIALTAKAMPDDRQHCLDAGANDYIAKPIDPEKLLSLLRVWMPRQ